MAAPEPNILFYNPLSTPKMTLLADVTFEAVGGGAIKAGDTSDIRQIAIWNNPYATNGAMDAGSPPPGGYGNASDGIVAATNVDVTTRDNAGGAATTDVVTQKWLNVQFPGNNGVDSQANDPAGKQVGFESGNSVAAVIGTIQPNNYFLIACKLKPPGTANAGLKNFVIRVSYSFS